MDPITGVVTLTGLTVAAIAGLRLKKEMEGFETLPSSTPENNYPGAVAESQTRYNSLTSMVNPLLNPLIPVGASESQIEKKQQTLNSALGDVVAPYDPNSPAAFKLKAFMNQFRVRTDAQGGLYDAIQFCRASAKEETNPFTSYQLDNDGNKTDRILKKGKEKVINQNETLKFDEVCGICLTSGVDEDGNPFQGRKGMLIDPSVVEAAMKEQKDYSYPFPRVAPSLGKCEGSPASPAFAVNQETLDLYTKRMDCMKTKEISESNNCGLCYENDTFSFVPQRVQKNTISLVLMGTGKCAITVKGINVKNNVILSNKDPISIPLILNQDVWTFDTTTRRWKMEKRVSPASESDPFVVEVVQDPGQPDEIPIVYGYLSSQNPNGGRFAMPLNLILTRDGVSNSAPNRTGGFHTFPENGVEVAKIRPGGESGREMRLTGEIPFTFVQSSEFSSIDCPSAPYQTKANSVTRFATDQPCYAKGSKPGAYNEACLRERILDVGCTNAGDLYKNPKVLNFTDQAGNLSDKEGIPNSLSKIYSILRDIASNDLIDPEKTRLCSGRKISSPCDYFRARPSLKMERILNGTDKANAQAVPNVKQCLSYLYQNKGAEDLGESAATFTSLPNYRNDTSQRRNIYCLPEGELNPERNTESLMELARMYDMGFKGSVGIDGVKKYLTSMLEMAVDQSRNANTDVERKAAIRKCFGTNFNPLPNPPVVPTNPPVQPDPPLYKIQDATNRTWKLSSDNVIRLNSGRPIEVNFVVRPDVFRANQGRVALFIDNNPSTAIRHTGLLVYANPFGPNSFDFAWYPIQGPNNTVFFYNDYGGGTFLGYDSRDLLILVGANDSRRMSWKITPYPSTFVKNEPSLIQTSRPEASLPTSFVPQPNRLIGTALNNGDYTLTMNLTPTSPNGNVYSEIVHFTTTGRDCCTPGERMPGIWFIPNTFRLHVRIGDTGDGNWGIDTRSACALNQTNTFSLECRGSQVRVRLNGETITLTQPSKRPTGVAQVFACTQFHPPARVTVSSFKFTGLN
jgi:hypothetical protein